MNLQLGHFSILSQRIRQGGGHSRLEIRRVVNIMFRLRFVCGGSLEVRREAYGGAVDGICERTFGGSRCCILLVQLGECRLVICRFDQLNKECLVRFERRRSCLHAAQRTHLLKHAESLSM